MAAFWKILLRVPSHLAHLLSLSHRYPAWLGGKAFAGDLGDYPQALQRRHASPVLEGDSVVFIIRSRCRVRNQT